MLKQTLIFSFRSFKKFALMNLLNVLGLALGLGVFFLSSLYIYQEGSYEKDFEDRDRIFQISKVIPQIGISTYNTPNLAFVKDELPELEALTVFQGGFPIDLKTVDSSPLPMKVFRVDSSFLKVFDFKGLTGDLDKVLREPGTCIIFKEAAQRLFGTDDVVGKVIYSRDKPFKVEAVLKDPQFKTQMASDLLIYDPASPRYEVKNWSQSNLYVYAKTRPNASPVRLGESLDRLSFKYLLPTRYATGTKEMNLKEWKQDANYEGFLAESLSELRYESETQSRITPALNRAQLNTMSLVGLAAMIISIINFINLSTAKASSRLKEVGIKRILGSSRAWLLMQFLWEAFVVTCFAAVIALGAVELLIESGPSYFNKLIQYSILQSSEWVFTLLGMIVAISFLAGIYPALYLSSTRFSTLLRKSEAKGNWSILNAGVFRKGATVLQFTCSISLIFAIVVMFRQVDYLENRDLGYDDEGVVVIEGLNLLENPFDKSSTHKAFRNEVEKIPTVLATAYTGRTPMDGVTYFPMPIKSSDTTETYFTLIGVSPDFFELMNIEFVAGRSFELKTEGDSIYQQVVINETVASVMGFTDPIGQTISNRYQVVGLIDDFFFADFRKSSEPMILTPSTFQRQLLVRSINISETRAAIENLWPNFVWEGWGELTFNLESLESNYAKLIYNEKESFNLIVIFSVIAVIISSLGLLGLAMFTVDQRIHEFGIRKVLGASITDIMRLFSWDFAKLITMAFVISIPISYFVMQSWLSDFTERISLSANLFVLAGLLTLIIVFSTISIQSLKAGRLNPVDTIKNE